MGVDQFEQDVVSFMPLLKRLALSMCRNVDQAEDLVQDTVLRALSSRHTFEPGTNIAAWLTVICRNLFLSSVRNRYREVQPDDYELSLVIEDAPTATEYMDNKRDLEILLKGTRKSDYPLLALLADEFGYREIAGITQVVEGTVKSRINRLRERGRQLLGRDPPKPPVKRKKPYRKTKRWLALHPAAKRPEIVA